MGAFDGGFGGAVYYPGSTGGYPIGTAAKFWYGADHFVSQGNNYANPVGPLGLTRAISGTGAVTTVVSAYNGALGVMQCVNGTDANGRSFIGGGTFLGLGPAIGRIIFRAKVGLSALSDATDRYTTIIGLVDAQSGVSADGVWFNVTDNVNNGEYQVSNANGSVITNTGTNVSAVAGTWKTFEIDLNAAANAVTCKIDNVVVSTTTTNLPVAGTEFTYGVGSYRTAGTSNSRTVYVDYMELLVIPTSQ